MTSENDVPENSTSSLVMLNIILMSLFDQIVISIGCYMGVGKPSFGKPLLASIICATLVGCPCT